jgi:hypothetical protein
MKVAVAAGAIAKLVLVFSSAALAEMPLSNSLLVLPAVESAPAGGPNLPPVGRSLFDFIASAGAQGESEYQIPFPFDRLVAELQGLLGENALALKTTLIPLGRSLQRSGALPDYFDYPRVVVAVTGNPVGQPADASESDQRWLLKDRLYLGYQERMNLIEVISYNEAAGRFEFQLVKNYGPGLTPEVYYTDRTVCGVCHQSHSPVFSKAPWDETAANPLISALLEKQRDQFYGIEPKHGIDTAAQIDAATDRAAFFSVYNQLWGPGCEVNVSHRQALSCRQQLLREMLRLRLTSGHGADAMAADFRDQLLARWNQVWPAGLAIPDVDLPNRAPLRGHRPTSGRPFTPIEFGELQEFSVGEVAELAQVDPVFEPSNRRAPQAVLTADDMQTDWYEMLMGGLSNTLSEQDISLIDQRLVELRDPSQAEVLTGECSGRRVQVGQQVFTKLDCLYSSVSGSGRLTMRLPGTLDESLGAAAGKIASMSWGSRRLTQLRLEPAATQPRNWDVRSGLTGLQPRFADGRALAGISLLEAEKQTANGRASGTVRMAIEIHIQSDFESLDRVLQRMVDEGSAGALNSLTRPVMQQSALMTDLHRNLGMPEIDRCCNDVAGMPVPQFSASLLPEPPSLMSVTR